METKEVQTQSPTKDLANFYNLRGVCHYKLKQFQEAKENFERATALDPQNTLFLKNLTELALENKEYEKAIPYLKHFIELAPEREDVKLKLAQTFVALKKFDEAWEIKPDNETILNFILGEIFKFGGQCKKCGSCCRGMVLLYKGDLIKSEEQFAKICEESPDFKRWVSCRDEKGLLRFSCSKLDSSGICTDYQDRQDLCRKYPNYMTSGLKDGCGFFRQTDFNFPPLRNLKLVNAIAEHAMKLGIYEEGLKLLKYDEQKADEISQTFKAALEEVGAQK